MASNLFIKYAVGCPLWVWLPHCYLHYINAEKAARLYSFIVYLYISDYGEKEKKNVKVLGTGCANCKTTVKLIDEIAKENGVEIQLEKVEEIRDIMSYGVMATPGVVIDGEVVHSGGVPSKEKIQKWFTAK